MEETKQWDGWTKRERERLDLIDKEGETEREKREREKKKSTAKRRFSSLPSKRVDLAVGVRERHILFNQITAPAGW